MFCLFCLRTGLTGRKWIWLRRYSGETGICNERTATAICFLTEVEWNKNNAGSIEALPGIQEFEASLHCISHTRYGQWITVDLHNHPPASHDFGGNKDTALDLAVARVKAKPVDVVNFTDPHELPDAAFVRRWFVRIS